MNTLTPSPLSQRSFKGRERGVSVITTMHYNKKIFARKLRKESTTEEKKLWKILRDRQFKNLKFRRQHVLQGFVVDFYCHELRLIIEIDGRVHEKQKNYDALRQTLIEEIGFSFIRITNEEINMNINILLDAIENYLTPPSPFSTKTVRGGQGVRESTLPLPVIPGETEWP
jgi:very-short-patch-repair endonuclease